MGTESVKCSKEKLVLARAVMLILDGKTEEAIAEVSKFYGLKPPRITVGLPKRCRRAFGCYVPQKRTIYLRTSEEYRNPFVVMHELYHHLRYRLGSHRGTEKKADNFALEAIQAYRECAVFILKRGE